MSPSTREPRSSAAALISVMIAALILAGCAAQRVKPDQQLLGAQDQREQQLAGLTDWSLSGRLAISGPEDGGSGSVVWVQQGEAYRFTLNAPVTGRTWTLTGDQRHAELAGVRADTIRGTNASDLLESELGWQVPIAELRHWVRGARAPGRSQMLFHADGLPAELLQAGWKVEYLDYHADGDPRLPRRVFASRGEYKVRLVVQRWETP